MPGSDLTEHYENLNLDQTHEFQRFEDSRFSRSDKPAKYLIQHYSNAAFYRIKRRLYKLIRNISCYVFQSGWKHIEGQ